MVDGFLYSKKHKYCVLYTSKCGCTSLRYFFLEVHKDEVDPANLVKFGKGDILTFFPVSEDITYVPKLLVVRNPYLRAVSMYTNKYIEPNSLLRERFARKGVELENGSFLAFLEAMKKVKQNGSEAMMVVSSHVSEQSYARKLKFPLNKEHVTVVQLENLESGLLGFYEKYFKDTQVLEKVKEIIATPNNCLKSNVTKRSSYLDGLDVAEMEFTDLKNIPHYSCFYFNPRCKQLVDEIYKNDFILYGYKMELPFTK